MSTQDDFIPTNKARHQTAHIVEALGAVLLLAVAGFAVFYYVKQKATDSSEKPPMTREEMIDMMSERSTDAPVISPEERAEIIETMSERVSTPSGTSPTAAPTPQMTAQQQAERAKLLEAMGQRAQ